MSHSPSIPDPPAPDIDPGMSDAERLEALTEHHRQLVSVNAELSERLDEVLEQRDEYREEIDKVQRENQLLKTASLYVATVEELLEDDEAIIKQHGNNQEVLTEVDGEFSEMLSLGTRVAVNDAFHVQGILDGETDIRAQAMQIERKPDVTYEDIGGLEEQIQEVREAVEMPLENPEIFETVGVEPPAGVLLYGAPGTGKTLLAKAVANRTNATFIRMAGSELVHKFIGEGARLVRDLFDMAEEHEPSIIFIDELDAIASKRTDSKTSGDAEVQRTMMQLLSNLDGFEERGNIRIIAATNRFDMLDEAILRPGRFDRLIEVPKPDEGAREKIFRIHTRGMNLEGEIDFERLAELTPEVSGADIKAICTEAGMFAIREERTAVTMEDFRSAMEKLAYGEETGYTHVSSDGSSGFY